MFRFNSRSSPKKVKDLLKAFSPSEPIEFLLLGKKKGKQDKKGD
jgi:hypothetical protein